MSPMSLTEDPRRFGPGSLSPHVGCGNVADAVSHDHRDERFSLIQHDARESLFLCAGV